ncbi:MAG: MBL fold metallo-hydrolase [Gemmataceae bacterium]|nr:MBL fold metallo-hydrolase [Gemmataceae bacterium]MDW8264844.1 MBL fold metallo-hydrolase [Gemmataceae bacterium]
MMRLLLPLLAVAFCVPHAAAAEPAKVIIRWHGQSFFDVESSQGTRIAFDPHAIEVYGRKLVKADLVLISHFHTDHTQLESIENVQKAKVIYGLKVAAKRVDWNIIDEQFRDVHIRTVGVYHDSEGGMRRGKTAVFVLTVDGLKIVFLGDLGHQLTEAQIRAIGPVDVLMIPVGGVYTLNGSEAKAVVAQLKPRMYILPMHYGTRVYDQLLPIDEFLDEQKKENIRLLPTTNKLTVETDFKPAEPIIAVLNWK